MNEEIDETEFYHQDFTTASEWEIFIARLEEVIREWKIDEVKSETTFKEHGKWKIKVETITFADVDFTFTYYQSNINGAQFIDENEEKDEENHPLNNATDYFQLQNSSNHHDDICLHYWYGLTEYMVLSPANNSSIVTESKTKVLLSSINIAIGNTNCEIPIFVQVREKWQKYYLGVYEQENVRTNFEMVHLRRGPQHCQYLSGLIDLFKTKILSPVALDPIIVCVQFSYLITDFASYTWKEMPVDIDTENFATAITLLPLGVTVDPIENLVVKTQWSQIPDNLIVDSETYSNFEPATAPKWILGAQFVDKPVCLLADCLTEFIHLYKNGSSIYEVLGDFASQPPQDTANPLDVLTESKVPTISSVLKRATRSSLTLSSVRRGSAPLAEAVLVPMLYFLFPDAEENSPNVYFKNKDEEDETVMEYCLLKDPASIEDKYKGFKTCKIDCLVWRLSIILCHALYSLGGVRAAAHIWFEFVQEMRYRWERSIIIPGLAPGFPDARTCLLHQKLQMLNCCIERKKNREALVQDRDFKSFDEGNSSDDEFYDASGEDQQDEPKTSSKYLPWNQPVGRLSKFEGLKLLKTGDQLYIPVTQDPVPKTEDQLDEYTDILLKLGDDAQGSELRARMMSASLLSDMESFKAANPGSILEDFIRWYSPRDWINDEGEDEWGQRKGHLSSRMLLENNTWVETWQSAKPVPANRQRRLFDDTREAEKVLHFFDSRTMSQISEMILPVLAHAALYRVEKACTRVFVALPNARNTIQQLTQKIERLSREGKMNVKRYELLVQELIPIELSLSQASSLLNKLHPSGPIDRDIHKMVRDMIRGVEVELVGRDQSVSGKQLIYMFNELEKLNLLMGDLSADDLRKCNSYFPPTHEREFVMSVEAHRPAAYSTKSPQLLRAVLSKNEFRLCGAFSEDITFF